jgi:hypothetical protein
MSYKCCNWYAHVACRMRATTGTIIGMRHVGVQNGPTGTVIGVHVGMQNGAYWRQNWYATRRVQNGASYL